MKQIYENKMKVWKWNSQLNDKSKVEIQEYLAMIKILRVFSSFSRLSQLKTIKNFLLIDQHSKDQKWVKINSKTLYKMIDNSENSYQRHVRKFYNHSHCSKIVMIDKLIKKWDFNKKMIFCSMSFMQAKILYHVRNHVVCCAAFLATWS
jgi:hypothetical protein